MGIYKYLKNDHKNISDLMEQVLASNSVGEQESLFEEVATEISLHIESEDATFYEALRGFDETKGKIEQAENEHDEIVEYISILDQLEVATPEWLENFHKLQQAVLHHVKEEEGEVFEKAKKLLTQEQADELASMMEELKQEMLKGFIE